jgi:hypothetical protein
MALSRSIELSSSKTVTNLVVGFVAMVLMLQISAMNVEAPATAVTWSTPTQIAPPTTLWYTIDMAKGLDSIYVLSFIYSYGTGGPPYLFKSTDQGSTWTTSSLNGISGEAGMCVYQENGQDVILVASGSNVVKSTDGGLSWVKLSDLPYRGWRFMAIGTNSSWFGTPPDDDIYVIGSMSTGGYDIGFTKSIDGGMTWSAPVQLTSNSYRYNQNPRITSDGTRLYVVYEIAGNLNGIATLVTRSSGNWGVDWSTEKVLIANTGNSYMLRPYCFQRLDSEKALLTYVNELASYNITETTGNYGYYNFSTESYVPVGSVSGPDWMVHEGFTGELRGNNFTVAWIRALEQNNYPLSDIMFSYSTDSGLEGSVPTPPSNLAASIDIRPDTLNPSRMGKYLTAYIGLPDGYEVGAIQLNSVKMNGQFPAIGPSEIKDFDNDNASELMVKFDASKILPINKTTDVVTISVSGRMANGTTFEGSDQVNITPSSAIKGWISALPQGTFGVYVYSTICLSAAAGIITYLLLVRSKVRKLNRQKEEWPLRIG